jgi:ABC-type multidrug transport system ATPase subunit
MIIHNVKGIEHGIIELPIENGLYGIVGNNGSGKSTIMSCLSQFTDLTILVETNKENTIS